LVFYHGLIRKSAHFFEYAVLTILAARAFTGSSIGWLDNHPFLAAVAVALIIAGLDELNQSFDPARTGTFRDVILDVSAAVTAALAFAAYRHFRKN
jgi:VanZ family protein